MNHRRLVSGSDHRCRERAGLRLRIRVDVSTDRRCDDHTQLCDLRPQWVGFERASIDWHADVLGALTRCDEAAPNDRR